jgi:predicted house-cleaning NTP pyrophosphatase (Maf/HAM1 superfamily)
VITGISIVKSKSKILHIENGNSMVKFKPINPHEVEEYVNTKEPLDKAGVMQHRESRRL